MKPKVCIVIANYNYSKWLEQSIKSALAQTYENCMISVVDDCSTDNSVDVALKALGLDKEKNLFSENPDQIVWTDTIHEVIKLKKNGWTAHARNVAIDRNIDDCDYFTVLDSDDFIVPDKVDILVKELNKFQLAQCIYADYFHLYNDNSTKYEFKRTYSHQKLINECIVHCGALFSKKALLETKESTGYFDERMKGPEDYDLWIRMAEKYMILHYAKPLSYVRVTGQNVSNMENDTSNKNYIDGFKIMNMKIQERVNAKPSVAR